MAGAREAGARPARRAFGRPPVARKVGDAGVGGRRLVSELDRHGWVTVMGVEGQQQAGPEQERRRRRGDPPRDSESVGVDAAEGQLPGWDSFISLGQTAGRSLTAAELSSSVASNYEGGRQGAAEPQEVSLGPKTRARIHRTGSVDILMPRKEQAFATSTLESVAESPRRTATPSPTRARRSSLDRVSQAQGLERYFEAQQHAVEHGRSRGGSGEEPFWVTQSEVIGSRHRPREEIGTDVGTGLAWQEPRAASRPGPRKLDEDQRVEWRPAGSSYAEQKGRDEEAGAREDEIEFWSWRQQQQQQKQKQKQTQQQQPCPSNAPPSYAPLDRGRGLGEEGEEAATAALAWFTEELDLFAERFLRHGPQPAWPGAGLSIPELQMLLANPRVELDALRWQEQGTDALNTRGVSLPGLPARYKDSQRAKQLWRTLDEVVYAFTQRERLQRGIVRESILQMHKVVKALHQERQAERVEMQKELAERTKRTQDEAERDKARDRAALSARVDELERALAERAAELAKAREDLDLKSAEAQTARSERDEARHEREEALRQREEMAASLASARADHAEALSKAESDWRRKRDKLQQKLAAETADAKERTAQLELALAAARDHASLDRVKEADAIRGRHEAYRRSVEAKMNQLVADHGALLERTQRDHRLKMSALRKELQMQLEAARQTAEDAAAKLERLRKQHQMDIERLRAEHKSKEDAYRRDLRRVHEAARGPPVKLTGLDLSGLGKESGVQLEVPDSPPPPPPPPPPAAMPPVAFLLGGRAASAGARAAAKMDARFRSRTRSVSTGTPPPPPPPPSSWTETRPASTGGAGGYGGLGDGADATYAELLDRYVEDE